MPHREDSTQADGLHMFSYFKMNRRHECAGPTPSNGGRNLKEPCLSNSTLLIQWSDWQPSRFCTCTFQMFNRKNHFPFKLPQFRRQMTGTLQYREGRTCSRTNTWTTPQPACAPLTTPTGAGGHTCTLLLRKQASSVSERRGKRLLKDRKEAAPVVP